jgi:hypothetical protein
VDNNGDARRSEELKTGDDGATERSEDLQKGDDGAAERSGNLKWTTTETSRGLAT